MVNLLYAVAGVLLILAVLAESPFGKTYLVVFATACFLLARFIRIERRLDRIQGIQRPRRLKSAASWAWSNREGFKTVGSVALFIGCLWLFWGDISRDISHSLSAISPKRPHPGLHAFLGSNRLMTPLLVWFPIGAFSGLMFLAVIAFYIIEAAMLLGFLPRTSRQKASARSRTSRYDEITTFVMFAFVCWVLFVMAYATKETDAFFALFPQLSLTRWSIVLGLLGGWMPLGFIAKAVQRRREKARGKLGQSSA